MQQNNKEEGKGSSSLGRGFVDPWNGPGIKGRGNNKTNMWNVNRLCNCLTNNEKLERAKDLHDELEVDIAAYNEHRLNMGHRHNINGFNQLFKGGEAEVRSVKKSTIDGIKYLVCLCQESGDLRGYK